MQMSWEGVPPSLHAQHRKHMLWIMMLFILACAGAASTSKDPYLAFQPPDGFAGSGPSGEGFGDSYTSHCPTVHL
jgi:hypothetical protein